MAERTGTLETCRDASGKTYYRGKVRLQDGSRVRVEVEERFSYSEKRARECVAAAQEQEDATHEIYKAKLEGRARKEAKVAGAAGETCDAWFARYHAYAKELGQTDAVKKRDRWNKWIAPVIGPKPIALVTRSDVEDIRDKLDAAVEAWKRQGRSGGTLGAEIAGKTAMNIWSCLTSSFRAATSSKRRDLRVLDGKPNPCVGVEPPGDRESRQVRRKTFLYPRDVHALLSCEAIDLEWREVHAIAVYTYLRPGELRVLTWADVDLEGGVISVTKAWDYADEKVKPPKTRNGVRRVPIDPTLAPLLERMREGKAPHDLVAKHLVVYGEDHLAELFRKHLRLAGLERVELHASTRTHVQANFRSCRDTGLTWLAMAGVDVTKIMRRAGHDHVQTTMGYVKLAEDLTGDLGTPFEPLPASLVGRSTRTTSQSTQGDETSERVDSRPEDAETAPPAHVIARVSTDAHGFKSLCAHKETPSKAAFEPKVDRRVDRSALLRELQRARSERRWVDADLIAKDLDALAGVVDLEARRRERR